MQLVVAGLPVELVNVERGHQKRRRALGLELVKRWARLAVRVAVVAAQHQSEKAAE